MPGRMQEFQIGCVKEGCAFGRTFSTKDAAAFPTVLKLMKIDEFRKMPEMNLDSHVYVRK